MTTRTVSLLQGNQIRTTPLRHTSHFLLRAPEARFEFNDHQRLSATISDRSPVQNKYGLNGLDGLGFGTVYGISGTGCVKKDGLRCHITRIII